MYTFLFTQVFSFVNMSKKITKSVFLAWPEENIRKQLEVNYNEEATYVIHTQCSLCKNNVKKINDKYAGKLVKDVVSYRQNGTSHICYVLIWNVILILPDI